MAPLPYNISVTGWQSFIRFLEALRQDYTVNKSEWENTDLDSFLEVISWKVFADILQGAKIYE